jgi:hypothetical protein
MVKSAGGKVHICDNVISIYDTTKMNFFGAAPIFMENQPPKSGNSRAINDETPLT